MVETNVFFGTAFPQQTERDKRLGATDSGQFLPAWKQEARDEQGRRRFHGAFTGGFSAGYFNTVGSKEGWTPSQYVSSRSSRGEQKAARVEDFMDEEDLQALASTKRLVTTDEFDGLAGTEKEIEKRRHQLDEDVKRGGGDMSFLTSSLMNLVAPTQDSTGMRLLRKMGWRPGQGVGPRTAFVNDDTDNDSTSFQQQMTLAPKDTPIVDYQPKTNTFGLGYDLVQNVPQVAEMRRFQQQQQDQLQHQNKQRPGASAAGFGIGVFDDDDDDVMLYDDEPGSSRKYHHTLYDDHEYNKEAFISREANKRKHSSSDDRNAKKARCSDGHLPLKGFHLSTQPQELGKWYPPPTVPVSFDEMHTQTTKGKGGIKKISGQEQSSSSITIDARGAMLGEKPIEARSVFDYMSSKTKERLAQATSAASEPVIEVDKTRLQVTLIPKDVAQLALRGFIPFGDTPGKQERYRHFLEAAIAHHTNHNESTAPTTNTTTFDIPAGMTHESGMKELDEFTKAARIFRPISSMMSGRFTTSSSLSSAGPPGSTNLEHMSFEGGLKTEEQWKKEKEIREKQVLDEPKPKLSQEAEAAAMDMFGQMTRTQHAFYPNRLLCKRFNVRNPHPDHVPQGPGHRTQAGSTSALGEKAMAAMLTPHHSSSPSTTTTPPKPALADTQQDDPALRAIIAKPSSRADDSNPTLIAAAKTATEENENADKDLDYERPAMDIFKAIFENSDDDDDDDDDDGSNAAAAIPTKNNSEALSVHSTTKKTQPTTVASVAITHQGGGDDDDFIGPPIPAPAAPTSPPSMTEMEKPFRPMFTKRESQDTKVHSEKIIVTPFQPRLSSSSKKRTHQRRRVSVSSDGGSSSMSSSEENDSDVEKKKRRRKSTTSKKKKKTSDDKKRRKHHSSSRHRHHHRTNETDDNDDKDRRHRHRRSKTDDHDNEKKSSSSNSSSRRKQEDDLSLWVEKKPAAKRGRARAEDLW
ncbi:hypothetical protein BCR42DRAFT_456442 [Absidia repens]|uniref:G-patch domain-containing protein n=1 Tax=Absidia repens TaxID=90262 RepID=A0A1X2I021_9FUNG|nr:hypothetical protein BCR42DRAFT_456442 [Absidia repens]